MSFKGGDSIHVAHNLPSATERLRAHTSLRYGVECNYRDGQAIDYNLMGIDLSLHQEDGFAALAFANVKVGSGFIGTSYDTNNQAVLCGDLNFNF